MSYAITNQRDLRKAFWRENDHLDRRLIPNYSGNGRMHVTDTRCAFSDWLDHKCRMGEVSHELAQRATLR